jgi:hypothetical protein
MMARMQRSATHALARQQGARVRKSNRYTDWQRTAGWKLKAQRPGRVDGSIEVSITAGTAPTIGAGMQTILHEFARSCDPASSHRRGQQAHAHHSRLGPQCLGRARRQTHRALPTEPRPPGQRTPALSASVEPPRAGCPVPHRHGCPWNAAMGLRDFSKRANEKETPSVHCGRVERRRGACTMGRLPAWLIGAALGRAWARSVRCDRTSFGYCSFPYKVQACSSPRPPYVTRSGVDGVRNQAALSREQSMGIAGSLPNVPLLFPCQTWPTDRAR